MSVSISEHEFERLKYFLKDDKYALLLCLDMIHAGHWYDDMIDLDNPRTPEDAKDAFIRSFRKIPDNPFFKTWMPYLQPLLLNTAQLYITSTNLEFGDPDERLMSFLCRNQILAFISHVIYVVGIATDDPDWIDEVGTEFWKTFKWSGKLKFFIQEEGSRLAVVS